MLTITNMRINVKKGGSIQPGVTVSDCNSMAL